MIKWRVIILEKKVNCYKIEEFFEHVDIYSGEILNKKSGEEISICVDGDLFKRKPLEKSLGYRYPVIVLDKEDVHHINTKMEIKFKETDKWKNEISDNVKKAIDNRFKADREKEKFYKKVADVTGYTKRNVEAHLNGETEFPAQGILILEKEFGFHRDEILGELGSGSIEDIPQFRKLYGLMSKNEDIKDDIQKVLDSFDRLLRKVDNENDILSVCDEIANYIKNKK